MRMRLSLVALVCATMVGCAVQPDPDRARPSLYVEAAEMSEAVESLVGGAEAQSAVDEAVAFALEYGFSPGLVDPQKANFTAEELSSGIADILTSSSLAVWNARVVAALAGDASAKEEVRALKMYDLEDPGLSAPPGGEMLHSQAITDLTVDVFRGVFPDPEATPVQASDWNLAPQATVTASSSDEAERSFAEAAVDGSILGCPVDASKEWSSNYEYDDAWIELAWDPEVSLNRVVLYDRPNPDDQVLAGTLTFSDGSTIAVGPLANDGTGMTVSFPPRTVTSVRFTVNSVADTTWATGLSEFEAWGTSSDLSLLVSFTHEAQFRFVDQSIPFEVVFTRDAIYRMMPIETTNGTAAVTGPANALGERATTQETSSGEGGQQWRIVEYTGPYRISTAERLSR